MVQSDQCSVLGVEIMEIEAEIKPTDAMNIWASPSELVSQAMDLAAILPSGRCEFHLSQLQLKP